MQGQICYVVLLYQILKVNESCRCKVIASVHHGEVVAQRQSYLSYICIFNECAQCVGHAYAVEAEQKTFLVGRDLH